MIKRIGLYSLPEGTDPEDFWKFHTEIHSSDVRKAFGSKVKKYVINRVVEVVRGESKFWGMVELWFEDQESMDEAHAMLKKMRTSDGKTLWDDFESRVTSRFSAIVEEKEILLPGKEPGA